MIRRHRGRLLLVACSLAATSACATAPSGPSVLALPGNGKAFDSYSSDDTDCRQYAAHAIGETTPNGAARGSAVATAAAGTAVGAAAGALFGAAAGNPGAGAAIGAGSGLLVGSAAGVGSYRASMTTTQQQYDNAYVGCMYAKGNQVPLTSGVAAAPSTTAYAPSPPPPTALPAPPPAVAVAAPPPAYAPSQFPPPPPGYVTAYPPHPPGA